MVQAEESGQISERLEDRAPGLFLYYYPDKCSDEEVVCVGLGRVRWGEVVENDRDGNVIFLHVI